MGNHNCNGDILTQKSNTFSLIAYKLCYPWYLSSIDKNASFLANGFYNLCNVFIFYIIKWVKKKIGTGFYIIVGLFRQVCQR